MLREVAKKAVQFDVATRVSVEQVVKKEEVLTKRRRLRK